MTDANCETAKKKGRLAFQSPLDIKADAALTVEEKIEMLRQWEQDLRELITASGEGMTANHPGRASSVLTEVLAVLHQLRPAM
jgi:hypothetical protein